MLKNKRSIGKDRREIERREPKRGVNIRHDDENYIPKRARKFKIKEDKNVNKFSSDK